MNKRILVSEEEKNSILNMHESFKNRGIIKEDEMMGNKQCTFTISELLNKNTQGLKQTPKMFTIKSASGTSMKTGTKVSTNQKITMGKGEIIFDNISGFGQASISCDGTTANINVDWD